MSIPTPESEPPRDPFLVEPAPTESLSLNPDSLDTERILRDTSALPLPNNEDAPRPTEGAATTDNESVQPPGPLNILAVVSLVLALTLSPFAAIFGYLAVGQIRRAGQAGEGLAWTAVALGWLWLVGYAVAATVLAIIWFELP